MTQTLKKTTKLSDVVVPDPIEAAENRCEDWAHDNVRDDQFKCSCGKWTPLAEAEPSSPSPYALPMCIKCVAKTIEDREARTKFMDDHGLGEEDLEGWPPEVIR